MAVTVINRPIGHKLLTDYNDAIILDVSGDAVLYNFIGHGLLLGDYIYIESLFDRYNGFKYVLDVIDHQHCKFSNSPNNNAIEFIQEADIQFRISELEHGFQCVHLPIVYELHSNLWPINEIEDAYTPLTIDAANNVSGYTDLTISGNVPNINVLSYIELIGDGPLAGAYQIIEILDPDFDFIINLAWDADNDFSGYEVRGYYNNYFITVNVYGGFSSSHPWYSIKPYELFAELKFIPDSEGNVRFSISDILKGQITTRNNLVLDTLPNNLDFATGFYIDYYESYDSSDGLNITSVSSDVTSDQVNFEGCAINAMLPFKSLNSGHLSDYVTASNYARWLTLFDRPIAVIGYFFDLSFINQYNDIDVNVIIYKSINGLVTSTETIEIETPGLGVLRIPITIENGYDQYCLQAMAMYSGLSLPSLSEYNNIFGAGVNWTTGSTPSVLLTPGQSSNPLLVSLDLPIGDWEFNLTASGSGTLTVYFLNAPDIIGQHTGTGVFSINLLESTNIIYFVAEDDDITINSFTLSQPDDIILTEQICIDIIEECGTTFTNDNLRITEGGEFRELE